MTDAYPVHRARLALAELAELEQADVLVDDAMWTGRLSTVLVHLLEYVDGTSASLTSSVVLSAADLETVKHALADATAWREPLLTRCCTQAGMCRDHLTDQQLSAAYARLARDLEG